MSPRLPNNAGTDETEWLLDYVGLYLHLFYGSMVLLFGVWDTDRAAGIPLLPAGPNLSLNLAQTLTQTLTLTLSSIPGSTLKKLF